MLWYDILRNVIFVREGIEGEGWDYFMKRMHQCGSVRVSARVEIKARGKGC